MRTKEKVRRADAMVYIFADLRRKNDPRVDGYMKEIGPEYNFSAAYREAIRIAKRQGDADILKRLKKYTKKHSA